MERRYFNQSQPQTMQIAVFLLYANAVLGLILSSDNRFLFEVAAGSLLRTSSDLTGLIGLLLALGFIVGSAVAAYLIANEKRIGYTLGLIVAAAPIVATVIIVTIGYPGRVRVIDAIDIGFLFDVALLALLLHQQTRSYQKVWFK